MKVQLDNHETALSIAKGKGVRQPVARDQHDRLSDLPKTSECSGLGILLIGREHTGTLERVFFVKSTVDSPPKKLKPYVI